MYDVLIIGGGPAGSAAGISLVRMGYRPIIFERGNSNRIKVCGDGLAPDSQRALEHLGVFEYVKSRALEIPRATIFGHGNTRFDIENKFYTLCRSELDQILRDEVKRLGGKVHYGAELTDVATSDNNVKVRDKKGNEFYGDCLILATGFNVKLAEQLGFEFGDINAYALRGYSPNSQEIDSYMVWFNELLAPGYGWIFPTPNNQLNFGVVFFKEYQSNGKLPQLKKRFEEVARMSGYDVNFEGVNTGAGLRTGLRKDSLSSNRVLLVGENIHTTYNLIGEGIGKALESGIIAAEAIAESRGDYSKQSLLQYDAKIRARMQLMHTGYTKATKMISNPVLNLLFTQLLHRSGATRKNLQAIIEEESTPERLFSISRLPRTQLEALSFQHQPSSP